MELKVIVECVESGKELDKERVFRSIDIFLVEGCAISGALEWLGEWKPDVVFAVGWHSMVVRALVLKPEWKVVPKVCCVDMPWRWKLRCIAARVVLGGFLRNYAAAFVPGQACARYVKWLGFSRVYKGLLSVEQERYACRSNDTERRGFVFVGRFSGEKRLDILYRAYDCYRQKGGAWPLDLYGAGGLPDVKVKYEPTIHAFVQPTDVPRIYAEHACLLLTSESDNWPMVALEARVSGCEVIMSNRCGNRFELGARVVRFGDVEMMAKTMLEVERGSRCLWRENLEQWDCTAWSDRVLRICREVRYDEQDHSALADGSAST